MYKQLRWIVITFFLIPLFLIVSAIPSFAEGKNNEEGKVIFRYKTDFEAISRFLGITQEEYFELRNQKSIVEIVKERGISEDEVFRYFVEKNSMHLKQDMKKVIMISGLLWIIA
ncbi:hypothetical protein [Peribacillus sp. NPDC097295]|uniref:hypothetical protein n=1 Tax=Peribacillus sp. NPDC097295 TaxID=3364402 RepID=UPI003822100F